ncbi:MAG TPA: Lrp/AsnC family transcriptional regulator [Sphingomonas sp.]
MINLDGFDRRILGELQRRGDIGPTELSPLVHLSPSQCSRRVARLREEGYIAGIHARLDPHKLNLGVTSYIIIKIKNHSSEVEERLSGFLSNLSEVVSVDYVAGDADYIIKILTRDLESYAEFISRKLMKSQDIDSIKSSIALKSIKMSGEAPLEFA